jgi:WD40 repeat protein
LTSRGTWRRQLRSSSALALVGAFALTSAGSALPSRTSAAELSFTSVSGKNSSVWVARADGSRPRKIARNAFAGALSPSGHWIAYLRGGDHPDRALPHLYLTRIRGGPEEEVARVRWFVWSPKQDRLAYADMKTLRVFDIKTGKSRILVRTPDVRSISFAPSGDALAFARDNGRVDSRSRVDIYSVKIADTRVRRLTNDGHSGEPVWGPTWIAYRHYIRTQWPQTGGTWLMQPDGSEKRPFARGDQDPGHAHYGLRPVEFSRDGTRLLACTDAEFGCSPVTFFCLDDEAARLLRRRVSAPRPRAPGPRRHVRQRPPPARLDRIRGRATAPRRHLRGPVLGRKARLVAHSADSAARRG